MERTLQGIELGSLREQYPEELRGRIDGAKKLASEVATSREQITHQTRVDSRATFPEKRYQALVRNELIRRPPPNPDIDLQSLDAPSGPRAPFRVSNVHEAAAFDARRVHRLHEPG